MLLYLLCRYYKLPRNLMSLMMNKDEYQIINFHPAPRSWTRCTQCATSPTPLSQLDFWRAPLSGQDNRHHHHHQHHHRHHRHHHHLHVSVTRMLVSTTLRSPSSSPLWQSLPLPLTPSTSPTRLSQLSLLTSSPSPHHQHHQCVSISSTIWCHRNALGTKSLQEILSDREATAQV